MEVQYIHSLKQEGLVALKNYKKGELIHILTGLIAEKPTKYTIQIGNNQHILDRYGIFINHSFDPNIKIVGKKLIAIKNIYKNDQICFDYNKNETKMANPFYIGKLFVKGKN